MMKNIFLSHPFLGNLNILNVYIEYEGPRLFSLENETGASFISYWIGDDSDYEKWFLIPCSKARIIAFEKKQIDLKKLLSQQEQDYFYKIEMPFDGGKECSFNALQSKDIYGIKLPKDGIFVHEIRVFDNSTVDLNLVPTHEVKISKTNKDTKSNVLLNHLTKVCENFCDLAHGFNSSRKVRDSSIQALNARYGSFAINLHANDLEKFEKIFSEIASLMLFRKPVLPFILQNDIDIRAFCGLLDAIVSTSVNFEFTSVHSKERVITINKNDAIVYLKELSEKSLEYISSIRVPQANDIDKVFQIVDLIWQKEIINAEILNVEPRHVSYYKHATRILDFVKSDGSLTSLGQKIALTSDKNKRMSITAKAFEESDCGWAWINWSDVTEIKDVDPDKATIFLRERCPSLTGTTVKRRADTLTSWYNKLVPYYISYTPDVKG
ncbi:MULTISPECIES: DUF6575 domain-containing protein [Klebsiella]|uniref:DUF6575 domain-containing protein n=1 Tax=Klebsiella TaxID=570 RepID=UPI0009834492|nr:MULTISPECIES: DUF6575 domain-containing protein [Klebsiella]MDC8515500.1 hypothetical protein [Klebsiella pneumoniae]MDK6226362.1 hypothetical protein [Klebsiella variicola]